MSALASVVARVLGPAELEFHDEPPALEAHLAAVARVGAAFTMPVDRAFLGGFSSDRIGTAFAAGYTEALRALFGEERPSAFAVTEDGGGAPRAMHTTLAWQADGSAHVVGVKSFVTLGTAAERIYVIASEGVGAEGKNQLRLVRVERETAGLVWSAGPALSMVPEVSHARLTLDVRVPGEAVLEGDAYTCFVKPFRTTEDIHVQVALIGHLLRMTRAFELDPALVPELIAAFVSFRALACQAPLAASTHVALAGALAHFERLLAAHATTLRAIPDAVRARFERDLPLRLVASKARAARLAAALVALG